MRSERERLHELIGGWPLPLAIESDDDQGSHTRRLSESGAMVLERLQLPVTRRTANAPAGRIPAILCRPVGEGPFPVVLYCHAHGNNYSIGKEELLSGRPALREGPYAHALVERGMAVLAVDLPCFGERCGDTESALSKSLLWQGDTLFGTMLRELASAIDWLDGRQDLDATRVATFGISMGATLAWWLAALDERVLAVAEICCLADLQTLVDLGAHDEHGIYMTVPGLLAQFSTADIASLIVPRPHLCAVGELDSLTPPSAVAAVAGPLAIAYEQAGYPHGWQLLVEPGSGHVETPKMRKSALDFLQKYLVG